MERHLHWAGTASLRLKASILIPGFAELSIQTDGKDALAWSSLFHPEGTHSFLPGTSVELMLPRQLVGRATVQAAARNSCSLAGVVPWAGWPELLAPIDEKVEVFPHADYLEVRAAPTISPANWLPVADLPLTAGARMLLDYRRVSQILVPLTWFLSAAEELAAKELKVAVVATQPLAFGISRQTILTLDLDEERSFRVFTDFDEALRWLFR